MKKFAETDEGMMTINDLLNAHEKHLIYSSLTSEVENQKSRFEKFWCWLVYGHLYKDGVCLRCGKFSHSK